MSEVKDTQDYPKVEIAVKNFGPIAEANIDLRPLTVFVGPSNTGKTYFSTLIYALHDIYIGLLEFGLLSLYKSGSVIGLLNDLLNDSNISEVEIQDLLKKLEMKQIKFKMSDFPMVMQEKLITIFKDTDPFEEEILNEIKNCFDLNSILDIIRLSQEQRCEMDIFLRVSEGNQEKWKFKIMTSESEVNLKSSTPIDSPFNDEIVLLPEDYSVFGELHDENRVRIKSFSHPVGPSGYYLPSARSGIMQSHRIIASSLVKRTTRVGLELFPDVPTMSGVTADFMERIILYEEKPPYPGMKQLAESLESDVLAGQIRLTLSSSGYPDFRYVPNGSNSEIPLNQSSSMVSELSPLVLFLRSGIKPGDTLIIEEPEAHLHPGAQADMAVILARLVRAGVRVIITTHSDWLLQEIGNLILEGLIEDKTDEPASWLLPEEVGAWHFQKDKPVKEIAFHPRRGFSPKDYQDVAEGLYNRSVNLQQKYEKQKGESEREST
ncbi:hypothetical protein C6501_14055 [Candidatus Poribacteria bacterium]|nr:MAG: hypothetical protein C6501_14055 [Candidatus Poribacteria bacterium]